MQAIFTASKVPRMKQSESDAEGLDALDCRDIVSRNQTTSRAHYSNDEIEDSKEGVDNEGVMDAGREEEQADFPP